MILEENKIWTWLEEIADPEVPVITIVDLGIVRKINIVNNEHVIIDITPTYSGCPAMDVISMQIKMLLLAKDIKNVEVNLVLFPSWTTDWMSENGKEKLKAYGIAPPRRLSKDKLALFEEDEILCPHCDSNNTKLISRFGSTSCKSLYQCNNCHEPFEHFKCH